LLTFITDRICLANTVWKRLFSAIWQVKLLAPSPKIFKVLKPHFKEKKDSMD